MELNFFLKGIVLGFAIAAPVGPIGILCIRKTLQFGRFSGFFSGLGAALADTLYGIIAAFGLTFVSDFLVTQQIWLRLLGGAFLFCLGTRTFFAKSLDVSTIRVSHKTLLADLISTFFLTLSNPLTVLSFVAVFAGFSLINVDESYTDAFWLITGIFLGSCAWWLILSEGVSFFRKKISLDVMCWINRGAGMLITGFAILVWLSVFHLKHPS